MSIPLNEKVKDAIILIPLNLLLRQMVIPLKQEIKYSIWEVAMTINSKQTEFRNVWIKTAEQQLFHELETEYGFPRASGHSK